MSDDFRFHRGHLGTWLDRDNGWHNAYLTVDLAEDNGWPVSDEDAALLRAYRRDGAIENEIWEKVNGDNGLTARATAYLQTLTGEGVEFRWNENALQLITVHGSPEGGVKGDG